MSETSTLRFAVCRGPAQSPFHAPRPPEAAPDLDMRPGEPVRSTLCDWLQASGLVARPRGICLRYAGRKIGGVGCLPWAGVRGGRGDAAVPELGDDLPGGRR
jgi:hypothetical protein